MIKTQQMVRGAMVAALYVTLTVSMGQMAYGPIQFRPSEALTVLPILFPEAIPGLYVGCLLANVVGGGGPWDVWLGSFITLLAAYLTYRSRGSIWAYLSPVVLNGVLVSAYLSAIFKAPYWGTVLAISASEALVVFALGVPLIRALSKVRWERG